jgi:hypothetical protein
MNEYQKEITRICLGCGMKISVESNVCPYCGKGVFRKEKKEPVWSLIGGILGILSGIFGLVGGCILYVCAIVFGEIPFHGENSYPFFIGYIAGVYLAICATFLMVCGIIAIMGGISAIKKERFVFAVVGVIFALFCGGIFGVLALVFIILGKDEFTS